MFLTEAFGLPVYTPGLMMLCTSSSSTLVLSTKITPVSMVFGALFTIFSKTEKIYSKRQKTPENPPDFCQFIIAKTLDLR